MESDEVTLEAGAKYELPLRLHDYQKALGKGHYRFYFMMLYAGGGGGPVLSDAAELKLE